MNLQCPAQATRRLMHWASRPAADMEGVGDVWIEKLADDGVLRRRSDFYELTAETLLGLRAHGRGVGAQHGRRDRALEGARPAPRADRAGDPDGLRRHGQAPVPGRLRAHRGRHGRDRRGARGDPRHRAEGGRVGRTRSSRAPEVREEVAELRAPRRRPRRARRGPPGRRRRGGRLAAEGRDRRGHRRLHARRHRREDQPARPDAAGRAGRRDGRRRRSAPSTDYLLAGANVGAAEDRQGGASSASRSSTRTRSGPGCGRPGWPDSARDAAAARRRSAGRHPACTPRPPSSVAGATARPSGPPRPWRSAVRARSRSG